MPCDPSQNVVTPPDIPEPSLPGFGIPTVPQIPIPNIPIPKGFPEDIAALINKLSLLLPSGSFLPNLKPDLDKNLLHAILSLLDYLVPFLAIYKFILPILNMILCIIEVLCSLTNPFKLISAIRKLFRVCLPEFLSLFPIFAIILMIISLILLIIALVEYIIAEIARIIRRIIRNIKILARIVSRKDAQSALVALSKIGQLICLLKNLMAILTLVGIILQIIKDILNLQFSIPPCDDSNSGADGCCTADVCPQFIKNGNITASTGTLQYLPAAGISSGLALPPGFPPIFSLLRAESWQLFDTSLPTTKDFYNITQPYDLPSDSGYYFFPVGKTYDNTTLPQKAPYTVDLRIFWDPSLYGISDPPGARFVRIKNCIVTKSPPLHPSDWNNADITSARGPLYLSGGSLYEDDGTTKIVLPSTTATAQLNTALHKPMDLTTALSNDGITYSSVEYTFNINYAVLIAEALITAGCHPDVAQDRIAVNTLYGAGAANIAALRSIKLPDILAAQQCVTDAIAKLQSNVTIDTLASFQAETTTCLNAVLDDSNAALGSLVDLGVSSNKTTFSISPSVQFTSMPINVKATLTDANGANLCINFPPSVGSVVAGKIMPNASFGTISPFTYDGTGAFTATINSAEEGSGTLEIAYNNNFVSNVTVPAALTQPITSVVTSLDYSFIGIGVNEKDDGKVRRTETDVANDEKI